ncbi:MAG: Do family serine endopeptidase [Hyphomicrobiaceae bacterium]|nr:Do family serine endopeptidase [Hyphomicrobiaceae bacterium]
MTVAMSRDDRSTGVYGRRPRTLRTAGLALLLAIALLPATAIARDGPPSLSPLAEKLTGAVVNISTSQKAKGPSGVPLPDVPKGSPFEEFFEDFFNRKDKPGGNGGGDRKVSSLGSGFVIDGKEGLIVTNHHVIEGADEIVVNFADGSKLTVDKVVGRDTKTDLALLKVTPKKPLTAVKFGVSDAMKVGDWVMAIGNPFGLGGSVSVGIISAKQRDINSGPYDDFLQTDAAINKGNSGGPLFNMDGDVIGVNTAIISPSGGSIGIGFAVPSDTATAIVDQLRQFGETRRGWLGVKIQTVTDEIAESLGAKENTGALVSSVTQDGPAAKGGVEAGDVIVKLDGRDVNSMRALPRLVSRLPVGKAVDVELLRKGERRTVKIVIGRLDEGEKDKEKSDKPGDKPAGDGPALLGMTLAPLDDGLRKRFSIDAKVTKGLVVTEVPPTSPAGRKGIKPGDVVVEAAQEPVASLADVAKGIEKVRKAGRRAVLLRVEDAKGQMRFVAVPVE